MTVTRRGTYATTVPATAGVEAATLPTHQAGDLLLVMEMGKYGGVTLPMTVTAGWTTIGSGAFATGQANATDTGAAHWQLIGKIAASSSETAPTFTPGATAPVSWVFIAGAFIFPNGMLDAVASVPKSALVDTNTASPLGSSPAAFGAGAPVAGDLILEFGVVPTDAGTTQGASTLTNAGYSGGTLTNSGIVVNALGTDCGAQVAEWSGFTGTESGAYTASMIFTGAATMAGGITLVALREAAAAAYPFDVLTPTPRYY